MMDYKELIHNLQCCSRVDASCSGCDDCTFEYCGADCIMLCGTAASAITTITERVEELQAENTKLHAELERVKREREILLIEKCFDCPSHSLRHLGYCDHCRWKEGQS